MKNEIEVKRIITEAMNEPKAPTALVEKALAMAREAEKSRTPIANEVTPTAQGGPSL